MPVGKLKNGARLIEPTIDEAQRAFVRAGNFVVEWLMQSGRGYSLECDQEALVIFAHAGGTIADGTRRFAARAMTVAIVPAGKYEVFADGPQAAIILASGRSDLEPAGALNADEDRDGRIAPIGEPYVRVEPLEAPLLLPIEEIPTPAGNARIRFLQSATMSINIVLYEGPRGNTALSPHAHDDIEQGTLALEGAYVHHLRAPWGSDASAWLEDVHLEAAAGSLLLIPPELIHTTEGVGPGRHFLLDIFAPPRRDFIAKGFVANAGDYRPRA